MLKKLLLSLIVMLSLTGCGSYKDASNNQPNNTNDVINNENNVVEEQIENNEEEQNDNEEVKDDYYVGTYYLALTDGTLAKDGSGTVILNKDKSCKYYSGWSDFGCKSFTVNDHTICLKTTETQDDVCFTLSASNDMLISSSNEKYMKE